MHKTDNSQKHFRFDYFLIFFSLLIILLIFFYSRKNTSPTLPLVFSPTTAVKQLEKAKVASVIDGDTIKLDNKQKVRFIGIDAPEIYYDGRKNDCFATESADIVRNILEKQEIEVEKDISDKDKYGRLLRYVYLDGTFINEILVSQGFAKADYVPPDNKYAAIFTQAQEDARLGIRGLWKECK